MQKPYVTESLITAISGIVNNSIILDIGDIVDGLTFAGFNRNDVLVNYKLSKQDKCSKEVLLNETVTQYAFDKNVGSYLIGFTNYILTKDEKAGQELISLGIEKVQETEVFEDNTSKLPNIIFDQLKNGFDDDLRKRFMVGMKSKDYVVYLREMLIVLSEHYHSLCKIKGLGDFKENEAINKVFENIPEKIIMKGVAVDEDTGKNTMEGLKNILNGVFKKLRNVMMHDTQKNCDISGDEFITNATLINNLLKESKKYFPLK